MKANPDVTDVFNRLVQPTSEKALPFGGNAIDQSLRPNVSWLAVLRLDQSDLGEPIERSVDERTANGEYLPDGARRRKIARNSKTVLRPLGEQSKDCILG